MRQIRIYGRHTSYNVQKVLWLADELGLEYTHTELGGRFGGTGSAEFLALNPMGKVPVLLDGSKVIWESNTIVRYLADAHSDGRWLPTDPYERSLNDRWLDWSIDQLENAFVGIFWGYYRTPGEKRDEAAIQVSITRYEACMVMLEKQLGDKPYLMADNMTVVDIVAGVFMHRIIAIDIAVAIPAKIQAWYKRLTERTAYRKWVMSDFSELKARLDY